MSENERPGLGVLGVGAISDIYFAGEDSGEYRIVAFADSDPEALERGRQRRPGCGVYDGLKGLLMDDSVDAIAVALPHALHASRVISSLLAGKNVICEKPLGISLEDAGAVLAAERATGGMVVVRNYLRACEQYQRLISIAGNGEIGQAELFRGLFASDRRAALADPDDWHGEWEAAGGGVLIDSGYHLVDRCWHLFGPVDAVTARMFRSTKRADGAEDVATIRLEHAGGTCSDLTCVWTDSVRPFRWECELYGTSGTAFAHQEGRARSTFEARAVGSDSLISEVAESWWLAANRTSIDDCIAATAGEPTAGGAVGAREAYEVLRIVLAGYVSAALGKRVRPVDVPDSFMPSGASTRSLATEQES